MDLNTFRKELINNIQANKTTAFFAKCKIYYSGRAEAELDEGERLIIIKSDNTILIHQPDASSPINYMKNDTKIETIETNRSILIKTENHKYKDYLDIEIMKVHELISRKLEDGKKLVLVGNEKDMSDMIKEKPEVISKDFKPLSREEHTKFGFIDVFGHDKKGNLIIIECKRYSAGLSAIQQLRRYVEKIMELKGTKKVKGIIAAPDIAKNAQEMCEKWGYKFVAVKPPKRLEKYNKKQKSLTEF